MREEMMDFFGENGGFTNKHGLERERESI